MKLLRNTLIILLAAAALLSLSGAALAEDVYRDYYIEPFSLSVSFPEDVRVLTRDMEDTDPNLRGVDSTASHIAYIMSLGDSYLEAGRDDETWYFQLLGYGKGSYLVFDNTLDDLSAYGKVFLEQVLEELEATNPGYAMALTEIGGIPFFTYDDEVEGSRLRAYFSIMEGYEFWMVFSAPAEDFDADEPVLDDILTRIGFGVPKPDAEETPADALSDKAEDAPDEDAAEEPAETDAPLSADTDAPEPAETDAAPVLYTLEEDEFTIELPADLYVLWTDMAADDPALAAVGMTAGEVDAQLRQYGNCLNAFPLSLSWELVAATQTDADTKKAGDAALLDEDSFLRLYDGYTDSITEELTAALGEAGLDGMEAPGSVLIGDYRFYVVRIRYSSSVSIYDTSTQYTTIFGGRFYSFTFNGGGLTSDEQQAILSTVRFTAEPLGVKTPNLGMLIDWDSIGAKVLPLVVAGVGIGAVFGVILSVKKRRKKSGGSHEAGNRPASPDEEGKTPYVNPETPYSVPGSKPKNNDDQIP